MRCNQCNKMVSNGKVYCNELCETRFKTKSPKHCIICDKFIGLLPNNSNKKCCSNECRGLLRKKESSAENICKQCGKKFYTPKSRKKLLCSEICRREYTSTKEHKAWRTGLAVESSLKKYGNHYFTTTEFVDKAKKTKLLKYGSETYINIEKARQTKLQRYGDENYNNQEKLKKTLSKKYNVTNYNQTDEFKIQFYKKVINRISDYCSPTFSFDEYSGVTGMKYSFRCNTCNNIFYDSLDNGKAPRCTFCNKLTKEESEVFEFISKITNNPIVTTTRDIIPPLELDIYIPTQNVAIELNGVFWHSELNGKSKHYHLNKTLLCNKIGIDLVQIFDHEWNAKTDILKSILQNKISPTLNKRIYARACDIREIESVHCSKFLEENHIQGNANASIRLGLFYKDELLQVLTFGKSRFSKKYEYEMVRFCSKKYYTVVGGLGKLFNYFIKLKNPTSIVTFADRRFFNGNGYEKIGFQFISHTLPNYYYFTVPSKLESRINYQKHKLYNKLNKYDHSLSEWENMKNNGYDRIWDCGNSKFEWKRKDPLS